MAKNSAHIVLSGGGTAGHLFPGLAVSERLAEAIPRVRITFCGVGKPFERRSVDGAGFEYFVLPARRLPRGVGEAVAFVVEQFSSFATAGRFLREECVDAVVGLGGYASVPMARAAIRRQVPLVLLEQNAAAGDMAWISESGRTAHCSRGVDLTPETGAGIISWSGAVSSESLIGCGCRPSRRRFPSGSEAMQWPYLKDDERERVGRRACIEYPGTHVPSLAFQSNSVTPRKAGSFLTIHASGRLLPEVFPWMPLSWMTSWRGCVLP